MVVAAGLVSLTGLLVSSSELPMDLRAVLWISQRRVVSKMLYILDRVQLEAVILWGAGGLQALCVEWPRQPRPDSQRRPNSPVALGSPIEKRRSRGTPVLRLIENFRLAKAPTTEAIALDMMDGCCCCCYCVTRVVGWQRFWRFRSSSKWEKYRRQRPTHNSLRGAVRRACLLRQEGKANKKATAVDPALKGTAETS